MMETKEQQAFLEKARSMGSVPGLDSIRELLKRLSDPQDGLSVIHVAGTNGKGSFCCYLQNVLSASGYRVGVYTSPAVFHERERYAINGVWISEEDYSLEMELLRDICCDMTAEGVPHPTIFEIETALAYDYFKRSSCDLVIMETGMGGSLDATNVMESTVCSVITSIGMDHMQFLGDTLSEIAGQKAGIMKAHCKTVSAWQEPQAKEVLCQRAKEVSSDLVFADAGELHVLSYSPLKYTYRGLLIESGMEGSYQLTNGPLAVETLLCLRKQGYHITDDDIQKGMKAASWPGRMEKIAEHPLIYLDGAHNLPAARECKKTIQNKFTNQRITYIMGVLADKDYPGMLSQLLPFADTVITVTPENPRALPAEILAREVISRGKHAVAAASFDEAADLAFETSADVIIALGSLSYLKDIRRPLLKRNEDSTHV